MAWVHGNSNSSSGSHTVTLAVTAGDIVVLFVPLVSGATTGVTDSASNTWVSKITPVTSAGICTLECWGTIASTTATLTITQAGSAPDSLHASNYSNSAGTIPGTVNNSNHALSNTVNLTTSVANTLVVGFDHATSSNAAGTGYTQIASVVNNLRMESEYQTALSNSAGTITVAFAVGTPDVIIALAFDPPSGAPATVVGPGFIPSAFIKPGVGTNPARAGRQFAFLGSQTVIPPTVNLLTCTDTLNDTSWPLTGATVAKDGTAGPFGDANEAWFLKENSSAGTHFESQNVTLASDNSSYTLSVYVDEFDAPGSRFFFLQVKAKDGSSGSSYFNTVTGATSSVTNCTAGTSVDGHWCRCWITVNSSSGATQPVAYMALGHPTISYTGDGSSGTYLARPQLELRTISGYVAVPCAGAVGSVSFAGSGSISAVGKELRAGSASLAGAGNFSATGKELGAGAVTLAGIGSSSLVGKTLYKGVATFAGVGAFSSIGKEFAKGSVSFIGTATCALVGAEIRKSSASFAGVGAIAPTGRELAKSATAFSGLGNFTPAGKELAKGITAFAGSGSFVPIASELAKGIAAFAGHGTLAPTDQELARGTSAFAGTSSFAATGKELGAGHATLAGLGSFSVAGQTSAQVAGASAFAGSGDFASVGAELSNGSVIFSGSGSLSATASELARVAASFAGVGAFTAQGIALKPSVGTFAGSGAFSAVGQTLGQANGVVAFAGGGSLAAVGKETAKAVGTFVGSGSFFASDQELARGTATLAGGGGLSAVGSETAAGVVALAGAGSMATVGQELALGVVTFTGSGAFAGTGGAPGLGTAIFVGLGALSAVGRALVRAEVGFSGIGAFSASGLIHTTVSGSVSFAGSGQLSAVPVGAEGVAGGAGPRPMPIVGPPIIGRVYTGQVQTIKAAVTLKLIVSVKTAQVQSVEAIADQSMDAVAMTEQAHRIAGFGWVRMLTSIRSAQPPPLPTGILTQEMQAEIVSGIFDREVPSYDAPEWEMPIVFRDVA